MTQVAPARSKRSWRFYLVGSLSFLLTALLAIAIVYFWEEIRNAQHYGYAGGLVFGVLGGITIIPAPSLLVTFTLGGVLNPVYVGLVSGFGEAIGGITVYLTGAGVGTMWTRLSSKEHTFEYRPGSGYDIVRPVEPKFWSKDGAFYQCLANWVGGKGGSWVIFVSSAVLISPFYFASLAAGSLRMGLLRFFLVSWAGKTVKGLTVAFAGYWGLYFLLNWMGA